MADLKPLIRYRKHIVDDKQRILAQLYREAERIEQQKQIILDQIEKEKELAEQMYRDMVVTDIMATLGLYIDGARKKINALDRSLAKMNERINKARDDIRQAFAELKKVEITQERREQREKEELKKEEEKTLDEIAITGFQRKQREEG